MTDTDTKATTKGRSSGKFAIILGGLIAFAIVGAIAVRFSERPAPPAKEAQPSPSQGVDPKSVGGPNDPRPRQ
jgi:hypothetical protein